MKRREVGYSTVELLSVIGILILVGAISFSRAQEQWRSEESRAVVNELAGWIGSVHRAALRGKRCAVTLVPATSPDPLQGGAVAGAAREMDDTDPIDNGCLAHSPLVIQSVPSSTRFTITPRNTTFSFTPRGTVAQPSINPLELRVAIVAGGATSCLRLVGILGTVKIGSLQGNSCVYSP